MSSYPNAEVLALIKQLVSKLTHFQEGTELFNHVEKHVINCVHNADSMVFLKKKDIDRSMTSLSDKFIFHGLPVQANDLLRHYENFLPSTTPKDQCECRLNIIKFLLCVAESPTSKFLTDPQEISVIQQEEEIDWPAYLKEGIGRWTPPPDESSDTWSDITESDSSINDSPKIREILPKVILRGDSEEKIRNDGVSKDSVRDSIQDGWFLKDFVYKVPESTNVDANIAIHWDEYLEHTVQGLIPIKRSSIISEFCILRELIWQCFAQHNSFTFNFVGNDLLPKENVTISSVRPVSLQTFLHKFLPYINLLHDFRSFHESLFNPNEYVSAPDTYRSYDNALINFIKPVWQRLVDLERDILKQSSTHTLLTLENDFKSIFHKMFIVKEIHQNVLLDFRNNDAMICSTTLLSRLHRGLVHCISKDELDVYLTLYLESLYKYFAVINLWVKNDTLIDLYNEFIVKQVNLVPNVTTDVTDFSYTSVFVENIDDDGNIDCEMGFVLRELSELCKEDTVFKLIYTEVLQIGKNIHFLRLLKKLHLLDNNLDAESLYDELIRRVLKEIASYFDHEIKTDVDKLIIATNDEEPQYKFPATCLDYCKYPTEMDRLENLVDTSDGFLMNAFRSFFTVETKPELNEADSLYDKISGMTTTLYPAKQIIDNVLSQILRERYSQSGYLVKSILTVDFQMKKHFELLRHLFLFEDDIIFPLYQRLFTQMIDYKKFENDIWLTTHLHDIMIDLYPKLYEKCLVKVDNEGKNLDDPLRACELIDIKYVVNWPVNIIIREKHLEMYSDLFRIILKVKWALYTLNHLYFNEIEIVSRKSHQPKPLVLFLRRLKVFRFHLLNEFSNIQHYILGYVFNKFLRQFEVDFEKSCNLDTLISAHSNFINSVYEAAVHFRDLQSKGHGFNLLLYIVRKFEAMWRDTKHVDEKELFKYQAMFVKCSDNLDPVIFPRDLTIDN